MSQKKVGDRLLFLRLFGYLKPYWGKIFALFCLSLLATPIALLNPLPLKIAIDSVIGNHSLPGFFRVILPEAIETSKSGLLIFTSALVLIVVLLNQLQDLVTWLFRARIGEKIALDFRATLFRQVQRLSIAYHDSKGAFDSTYRIQYDAPAIQHIAIDGLAPFITAFFTLGCMIFVMAKMDWQLSLVALTVLPVLFILSRGASKRIRRHWQEMKDKENSAIAVIQEALSTVRVVKAFGKEEEEEKKFLHRSTANLKKRYELILFQGGFDIAVSLTMAAGTAAVLFLGVCHVQEGTLTLGGLLIVMTYLSQLYAPLQMIGTKATDIQSSLVSVERAFALLDEKPDVHEKPHAKHLVRSEGALTFQDVSFSYNPDRAILQDLSFKIEPGSCVGIVGRTGAGKTTLLSLLLRFYDPTSGRVLLDGVDLKEYRLTDLRNQYAVVFQEPVLFSTTIGENIAYARPGAKESEIIEAAKAAHAHDFIVKMPKGYETRVGDRGMSLSGGERQRISLARAFLRNAPILILDEPTSAVDTRTEALIMEAVDRLMAGRTTFMVAHRLSTLAKCNFLIRMEEGRLISPLSAPSPDELRELVSLKAS